MNENEYNLICSLALYVVGSLDNSGSSNAYHGFARKKIYFIFASTTW